MSTKEGVRTRETDFGTNAVENSAFELAFAYDFHDQKRLHLIHKHLHLFVTAIISFQR